MFLPINQSTWLLHAYWWSCSFLNFPSIEYERHPPSHGEETFSSFSAAHSSLLGCWGFNFSSGILRSLNLCFIHLGLLNLFPSNCAKLHSGFLLCLPVVGLNGSKSAGNEATLMISTIIFAELWESMRCLQVLCPHKWLKWKLRDIYDHCRQDLIR